MLSGLRLQTLTFDSHYKHLIWPALIIYGKLADSSLWCSMYPLSLTDRLSLLSCLAPDRPQHISICGLPPMITFWMWPRSAKRVPNQRSPTWAKKRRFILKGVVFCVQRSDAPVKFKISFYTPSKKRTPFQLSKCSLAARTLKVALAVTISK